MGKHLWDICRGHTKVFFISSLSNRSVFVPTRFETLKLVKRKSNRFHWGQDRQLTAWPLYIPACSGTVTKNRKLNCISSITPDSFLCVLLCYGAVCRDISHLLGTPPEQQHFVSTNVIKYTHTHTHIHTHKQRHDPRG